MVIKSKTHDQLVNQYLSFIGKINEHFTSINIIPEKSILGSDYCIRKKIGLYYYRGHYYVVTHPVR